MRDDKKGGMVGVWARHVIIRLARFSIVQAVTEPSTQVELFLRILNTMNLFFGKKNLHVTLNSPVVLQQGFLNDRNGTVLLLALYSTYIL